SVNRAGAERADAQRSAALKAGNPCDLPVVQHAFYESVRCQAASPRKIPGIVHREHMRAVIVRFAVIELTARHEGRDRSLVAIAIGHCFGPCPRGAEFEPPAGASAHLCLKRVITRIAVELEPFNRAVAGVGTQEIVTVRLSRLGWVLILGEESGPERKHVD